MRAGTVTSGQRRHRVDGVAQSAIAHEIGVSLSAVEKHLQKAYRAIAAIGRDDTDGAIVVHKEGRADGR